MSAGAGAVEWAGDGAVAMLTELLSTKLGMGKSSAVLSGFSFVQLMTTEIKLEAKSFLQTATTAATAGWTISVFS